MTAQEMMLPWFGVIVDTDAKPEMIARYKPGDFDGPVPPLGLPARRPTTAGGVTIVPFAPPNPVKR
jgi:hypothetical protein